jgi:large subunit ribosomal protein L9
MEVILVEEVEKLGGVGDLVAVKPGYARNFLLPRRLAVLASTNNRRRLEHEKRVASFRQAKAKAAASALAGQLTGVEVTTARKSHEENKIFGSVGASDIAEALAARGVTIDRRKIQLAEPIKQLGTYPVTVRVSRDVASEVRVNVIAE